MDRITVVSESVERAVDLKVRLGQYFETECICLDRLTGSTPGEITFVDVDLKGAAKLPGLTRWLTRRPANAQVIFGIDLRSHLERIQAYAFGATGLLPRPVDGKRLAKMLLDGKRATANNPEFASDTSNGIAASIDALQKLFAAVMLGDRLDMQTLDAASATIVEGIEEEGLERWLDVIRKYHSQTYQHCLLVTTVAVSFGRQLGFSNADKRRLASAGLLHDVGKARIPIQILEKPTELSFGEAAVMRSHPQLGFEALRQEQGLHAEMLDIVLHHHEYLDGSGYPDGLAANDISDLVRTMTIADIFGALIEQRSYKPPWSGEDAYQYLIDMGPKLDKDLVREFRPLARSIR